MSTQMALYIALACGVAAVIAVRLCEVFEGFVLRGPLIESCLGLFLVLLAVCVHEV